MRQLILQAYLEIKLNIELGALAQAIKQSEQFTGTLNSAYQIIREAGFKI